MKSYSILPLVILAALVTRLPAGEQPASRCAGCGCAKVKKVCRLVCQMREDVKYEYDVDRDDYCLPAKSEICGKKWVHDCKAFFGCRKTLIWQPRCACKIRTRKTLVKIPVVKKVPVYNCVVESVCCGCGKSKVDAEATARAREQGIRPASVDQPIVLDDGSTNGESPDALARTGREPTY